MHERLGSAAVEGVLRDRRAAQRARALGALGGGRRGSGLVRTDGSRTRQPDQPRVEEGDKTGTVKEAELISFDDL